MKEIAGVGLGLRWQFLSDVLAALDEGGALAGIDFFEVAPENYMRRGGYFPAMLERVAERLPLLSHGLTLDVGGTDPLDARYLAELRGFLDRFDLPFHSDHLCFCGAGGALAHDLLPLPFTRAAARRAADRVKEVRDRMERPIAIENITYYLVPGEREMDEASFLGEVLERADCGLLLDVNNLHVNWLNHGGPEPAEILARLPLERVVSIHVAGHDREGDLVIDTHGAAVPDPVYTLLEHAIARIGPVPVVVERDHRIPSFEDLVAEASRVRAAYDRGLAARGGASAPAERASPPAARAASVASPASDPDRAGSVSAQAHDDASLATVQRSFVGSIVSGDGGAGVYRKLVRRGLADVLKMQLARTAEHLGARWGEEVERFLDRQLPVSHYLRDTAFDFFGSVSHAWRRDPSLPPYIRDLASHELLAFEVANAPDDPPLPAPEDRELSLDRKVQLSASARVVRYRFAVHLVPEPAEQSSPRETDAGVGATGAPAPTSAPVPPAEQATALCVYRDPELEIRTLALTPSAAEILERLAVGATLGEAVTAAAAACGLALDAAFLQGAGSLLEDLTRRGVVRGPM